MTDRFIARQPIFDRRLKVFGYELLFRAGPENCFRPGHMPSEDVVVNSTMLFDMKSLVGSSRAFFNVDAAALEREVPRLLSPQNVVLEVLETVEPTAEVVEHCAALAAENYTLAIDDFLDEPKWQPLIPYVRFLKVDFLGADRRLRSSIAERYLPRGIQLVAEKVESEGELENARNLGYAYYQGFFFCKPSMFSGRDIPASKPACLRLLQASSTPNLDYASIDEIFRSDPSLTYRLLRFLNSPALAVRKEIHNVRHALSMLGEREFRRWVAIVALVTMAAHKPPELVKTALTRAYFCEEMARPLKLDEDGPNLFLMGLLSTADALLDRPIEQVVAELSLSREIGGALTGGASRFSDVYESMRAYEIGNWPALTAIAAHNGCPESEVPERFLSAVARVSATVG